MSRIFVILILILLGAAAFHSVRLAWADAAHPAVAMALIPDNATYLARAALQAENDGRDATPLLEQIVDINPTSSQARIRLGLAAEQRGDAASAEKWLLEAFGVDRQFETRWSLANFYFRQNRIPEFWKWMGAALEMSYGDRTAAFDLCWRASSDPAEILRVVPQAARDAYLAYVVRAGRSEAIAGAAAGAQDYGILLSAVDALIGARRFDEAVRVWIRAGRPEPRGVTAPRFEQPSAGRGFDWRFAQTDGVAHQDLSGGRGHRVRLSGRQPETVLLLSQYLGGLQKAGRYQLKATIESAPQGLEWRLNGQRIDHEWVAPAAVVLLELWYVRPPGSVREEGVFDLREVTVLALH